MNKDLVFEEAWLYFGQVMVGVAGVCAGVEIFIELPLHISQQSCDFGNLLFGFICFWGWGRA